MDFSFASFLFGGGAVIIVGVILAYWDGEFSGESGEYEHSDPALRELYTIATKLDAFYQVAAHPSDVLTHDLFRKGTEKFLKGNFAREDLLDYARGDNAMLACMAIQALRQEYDDAQTRATLMSSLNSMSTPPLFLTLRYLGETTPADEAVAGEVIIEAADHLWNDQTKRHLEDFVRLRAAGGETLSFGDSLSRLSETDAYDVEQFIASLSGLDTSILKREMSNRVVERSDTPLLRGIGKVWEPETLVQSDTTIDHPDLTIVLDRLEASFEAEPPKSVLVVGEPGVGKSAAISRLSTRLNAKGWTVFMAGHAELVAGQSYIGQFEEQLQRLIEHLSANSKVLWFIPAFDRLAYSGRHKYSPASALDTLLPYVESGEVKIIGEVSRAAYERLTISDTRIANAFSINRIEPLPEQETLALARQWLDRSTRKSDPAVLKEAWHLARHYLSENSSPGNLLKFLKLTRQRLERGKRKGTNIAIRQEDLLATLIELTGLSDVMLNEDMPLDLDALRTHFHQRVIGQDEAIGCLVERIAMIKAGVTDPTRPAGVFLFAGPTGTGKTEIAKALSEWLFGSPDRMIRLDMSELQTPESLDRLIGTEEGGSGALTDLIHEQPFSIVLLDEFEKAHPTVWDLFLQVFDDGRLTDRKGRTADFRHSIVVLTSNLGAAIPTDSPMGFSGTKAGFDPATVMSEVEKVFRREFINRIDRVVVFRPLSREVMRSILQKELDLAFQRRGLRSRSWAVEWDEAAIDFLLEQGFTPDLGARPLKRAIDRHLLAPLAQTIVNRQVPAGDQFLFVTRRDNALAVEFVDPDAEDSPGADLFGDDGSDDQSVSAASGLTLRSIVLQAEGGRPEFEYLFSAIAQRQDLIASDTWKHDKEATLSFLEMPDFWQSPDRFHVLGQVELIDRIEAATRRVGSLLRRIGGPNARRDSYPSQIIATAAQSLYLIDIACGDLKQDRPLEAFLMVETGRQSAALNAEAVAFARRLSDMYQNWAKKRRMQFKVLEAHNEASGDGYRFVIAIGGFGAHTILQGETGLHVFERPVDNSGKMKRVNARVCVVPQPPEPADTNVAVRRRLASEALAAADTSSRKVVRRYREEPSPLVRDAVHGWRTGRCDRVFDGDFDLFE